MQKSCSRLEEYPVSFTQNWQMILGSEILKYDEVSTYPSVPCSFVVCFAFSFI